MDQHPVPRQITTFEFKLIGFMTLRQFLYLVVFFPIGYIIYIVNPIPYLNIFLGVVIGMIGVAFAFIQIQGRPLEVWIKNLLKRLNSPTQYTYKKRNDTIKVLTNLYFIQDPHVAMTHVDTKEKLLKYLETKKNPKQVGNDQRLNKQKNHIEDLLVQTKNTNPLSIKKVNISFPQSGDIESQSQSSKQPFLTGIVRNQRQIPLPGILVSIKNNAGVQIRLLKTNPHGIFATYSNLNSGVYDFEISDPKGNYFFDTMKLTIGSDQQKPLAFYSKELL